jgi:hypothetical protein
MSKVFLLIIIASLIVLTTGTIGNVHNLIYAQIMNMGGSQNGNNTTFTTDGTISSEVGRFILTGPYVLNVRDGKVSSFIANITSVHGDDGSDLHYHTFCCFNQLPGTMAVLHGNNSVTIRGFMDVGLNKKTHLWPQVPAIISIKNGTALSVILNDFSKVYPSPPVGPATTASTHFTDPSKHIYNARTGSEPVTGLVKDLTVTIHH